MRIGKENILNLLFQTLQIEFIFTCWEYIANGVNELLKIMFYELFVLVLKPKKKLAGFEDHWEGFVLFLKKRGGKGQRFLEMVEQFDERIIRGRICLVHLLKI